MQKKPQKQAPDKYPQIQTPKKSILNHILNVKINKNKPEFQILFWRAIYRDIWLAFDQMMHVLAPY